MAGHDRGARVAFRMALDHPDRVERMAALDIVPTHEVLTKVTLGWGLKLYHWFFMAQKAPFPERLICADLTYYIGYKLNKKGVGLEIFSREAMAEYARCTTPEQIHAICEDYRATVTLDLAMDRADFGARRSTRRCWCCGEQHACRAAFQAARGSGAVGAGFAGVGDPDGPLSGGASAGFGVSGVLPVLPG